MEKAPTNITELDTEISNFDGVIAEDLDKLLRAGDCWTAHPAWNHWGRIWFAEGKFHEHVMQYRVHVATISADTLPELIEEVNSRWGEG